MEIKLAKTFYRPECLEMLALEFRDQLEIRLQAETAFDFSVKLFGLENGQISEFNRRRVLGEFLNRFLENSINANFA